MTVNVWRDPQHSENQIEGHELRSLSLKKFFLDGTVKVEQSDTKRIMVQINALDRQSPKQELS